MRPLKASALSFVEAVPTQHVPHRLGELCPATNQISKIPADVSKKKSEAS